jgi:hypothetical protein
VRTAELAPRRGIRELNDAFGVDCQDGVLGAVDHGRVARVKAVPQNALPLRRQRNVGDLNDASRIWLGADRADEDVVHQGLVAAGLQRKKLRVERMGEQAGRA